MDFFEISDDDDDLNEGNTLLNSNVLPEKEISDYERIEKWSVEKVKDFIV